MKLEVSHLFRLGEALGLHPGEFLDLALPRRAPARGSTRDLLEKAREALRARSEAGIPLQTHQKAMDLPEKAQLTAC